MNSSPVLLEIRDLTAGYPGRPVVSHVDLTVSEQDFIGIIGPNGGGKTTLIRTIAGLLPPLSGEILYHFESQGQGAAMGYLPQVNSFDKRFPVSVKDVVLSGLLKRSDFGIRNRKQEVRRVEEILERFGIAHLAGKSIGALSGGQMQRVFLGRALISKPKLLLLDEPSTYADNRFEAELYEILADLNREIAILMVSHDLGVIPSYVKSIACVNGAMHYHPGPEITQEILKVFNCPIELITHGPVPHRVLSQHTTHSHDHGNA